MIALLSGRVARIEDDFLILDVQGVGYRIFASRSTLSRLPNVGEATQLEIETQVREDHIHLYGFGDQSEKRWFNLITTVQGVGAKVGLAILGVLPSDQLAQAISAGDKTSITRAPGVGPKLAQRIISELKDKVAAFAVSGGASAAVAAPVGSAPKGSLAGDVASALVNLGYSQAQVSGVVASLAAQDPDMAFDDLFRAALAELAR
jgi:Holliday junction DNA helicase RuvA